jgi:DNA-binding XRE family transcriptional regulator
MSSKAEFPKPNQVKAARALLWWTQGDLAEAASCARQTINDFETGKHMPIGNNLAAIVRALSAAGVVFGDDGSVKLGAGR